MKIRSKAILFLILLLAGQLSAQQVISIIEKDRDGRYLDKENPGQIKEGYKDNKISDINSVLEIQIDLANLNGKIGEIYDERLPEPLAKKISSLLSAMEQRNTTLKRIEEIVNAYDYNALKNDATAYDSYIESLAEATSDLIDIIEIDDRIKNEYFKLSDADDLYSGVYKAAGIVLANLEKEYEQFARDYGIYIQFGGWLITKNKNVPVHLEGFDDIAPQTPYTVDRWQFIPTGEQLKELEAIQQLAQENRDLGLTILKVTAQNQLEAIKAFGNEKLHKFAKDLEDEILLVKTRLIGPVDPMLTEVLDSLDAIRPLITGFTTEIETRLSYYKTIFIVKDIDVNTFLYHAETDISFITSGDGYIIKNKIVALAEQFDALAPDLADLVDSTKYLVKGLHDEFLSGFRSFKALAKKKASEFINGVELDLAALEFSNEVYKLAITDLPTSTDLDLINTGVRKDGDRLVLKMTVLEKNNPQVRTLETRELYLFRVLPHVITTVGVIFADPLANTAIQTQFQMAPSCNFLFKGLGDQKCRRRSVAYNRMFDWGFGLHIAAPDFDKDDVPELSAGLVVSTLHDYLQSGFGINIFTGDPYWFFGLRFPIPTFNIGASSQVQVE